MRILTISAIFALLAVGALTLPAFADHDEVTVDTPEGAQVNGCQDTDTCFIPSTVTIDIGGVVIWTNSDTAAHTVVSGTIDEGFDRVFGLTEKGAPVLTKAGEEYQFKFEEAGTYPYFCTVHPWMSGAVIVVGTDDDAMTDDDSMMTDDDAMTDDDSMMTDDDAMTDDDSMMTDDDAMTDDDSMMTDDSMMMGENSICSTEGLTGDYELCVSYDITGGEVTGASVNQNDSSLVFQIDSMEDGEITLYTMPSDISGANFVLVDGEEWDDVHIDGGEIMVSFPAGTEEIEVFGASVIPEFGTIAMIILGVAITSIVAVTAKSRMIPRL